MIKPDKVYSQKYYQPNLQSHTETRIENIVSLFVHNLYIQKYTKIVLKKYLDKCLNKFSVCRRIKPFFITVNIKCALIDFNEAMKRTWCTGNDLQLDDKYFISIE